MAAILILEIKNLQQPTSLKFITVTRTIDEQVKKNEQEQCGNEEAKKRDCKFL